MFKSNLSKQYQEYWSKNLNKDKFDSSVGNKLSLYSELKNEVRFETYLDLLKNFKTSDQNADFLPLATHWIWALQEDTHVLRDCSLCNRSEIGDEIYYLLKCNHSSLSHIRGIFLEGLYSITNNFTNMSCKALFLHIMSMYDENIIDLSASYIEIF